MEYQDCPKVLRTVQFIAIVLNWVGVSFPTTMSYRVTQKHKSKD